MFCCLCQSESSDVANDNKSPGRQTIELVDVHSSSAASLTKLFVLGSAVGDTNVFVERSNDTIADKCEVREGLSAVQRAQHIRQCLKISRIDSHWYKERFPSELMIYPDLPQLYIGHSGVFAAPLRLTPAGHSVLRRVLLVLTHLHPDLVFCPLLVQLLPLLFIVLGVHGAFAAAHAMVKRSRQDKRFFPLNVRDFTIMSLGITELTTSLLNTTSDELASARILEQFPLNTQLHILDCFVEEGRKVIFRLSLLLAPQRFVNAFVSSRRDSAALMQRVFAPRLKRTDIEEVESEVSLKMQQQMELIASPQPIPAWPKNLTLLVKVSKLITIQQWMYIWTWVPRHFQHHVPELLFSTAVHGFSHQSFIRLLASKPLTLLFVVVKNSSGGVFGAVLPGGLSMSRTLEEKSGTLFTLNETPPESWTSEKYELLVTLNGDDLTLTVLYTPVLMLKQDFACGISEPCELWKTSSLSDTDEFECTQVDIIMLARDVAM